MATYTNFITTDMDFVIGDPKLEIFLASDSTSYTYDISFMIGDVVFETKSNVTTVDRQFRVVFNFNDSDISRLYNILGDCVRGLGTITCTTYYKGQEIDYDVMQGLVGTSPDRASPIFSNFTFSDANSVTSNLTGGTKMIKTKSNALVTIPMENKAYSNTGASIVKYRIKCGDKIITESYSSTKNVSGTIHRVDDETISVTAIDSRGYSTTVTKTIPMLPYYSPYAVKVTVKRENGIGTKTKLNLSARFWGGYFKENVKNTNTIKYRYCSTDSFGFGDFIPISVATYGDSITFNSYVNGDLNADGFDNLKSYKIQIICEDSLGTTTLGTYTLNNGIPVVDFYKNNNTIGFGVGKVWERGTIDSAGDIYATSIIASKFSSNNRDFMDYETGTWNPIVGDTNGTTIENICSIMNKSGDYIKIGNLVIASAQIDFRVNSDWHYDNIYASVLRLPYSCYGVSAISYGGVTRKFYNCIADEYTDVKLKVPRNSSRVDLYSHDGVTALRWGKSPSTGWGAFYFTVIYQTS